MLLHSNLAPIRNVTRRTVIPVSRVKAKIVQEGATMLRVHSTAVLNSSKPALRTDAAEVSRDVASLFEHWGATAMRQQQRQWWWQVRTLLAATAMTSLVGPPQFRGCRYPHRPLREPPRRSKVIRRTSRVVVTTAPLPGEVQTLAC